MNTKPEYPTASACWKKAVAWTTLILYLTQPTLAAAQVVTDAGAPADRRPAVETSANGTPVVQITAPSAAGVSRNHYLAFNVGQPGLILNNSQNITSTQLAGYITGNPNLTGQAARIILNEVTGANPSYLNGYTEIAGQKADLILANPNGIVGAGFGFINAGRTTLTTGTPVFGGSGSLEAFRVTRGTIAVQGDGLDGSGADRVDLISRAVTVNAGIWAGDLHVVTGANEVSYANLGTKTIAGEGDKPAVALDVSALGGMYANKIRLVGTENGVGVNSRGVLAATGGDIILSQEGKISLAGTLSAAGDIAIDSSDHITSHGTLYARESSRLTAAGTIETSGTIASGRNTILEASGIASAGVLAAGVDSAGKLGTDGSLTLTAKEEISARGQNLAAGSLHMVGTDINLTGATTYAGQAVHIAATTGAIDNRGGKLGGQGPVNLQAETDIKNAGGQISGGQALDLTAGNAVDNSDGQIETRGELTLRAQSLNNQNGRLTSLGENSLAVTTEEEINNESGVIGGNGTVTLATGQIHNTGGQLLAKNTLAITAGQNITNRQGQIASGDLSLTAGETDNTGGKIMAQAGLQLTLASKLDNIGGLLSSGGNLALRQTGGSIANQQGIMQAGGSLTIDAGGTEISGGEFAANSHMDIQAAALTSDTIQTGNDLNIRTETDFTATGPTQANGQLTVQAGGKVTNQGTMTAVEAVRITAGHIGNEASAAIKSGSSLELSGTGLTNRGIIYAREAAVLEAAEQLTTNGTIAGGQDVTLTAQTIQAAGTLVAGLTEDGTVGHAGDLSLRATGSLTANGQNLAAGNLAMQGNTIDLSGAETTAGQSVSLTAAGDIDNRGGHITAKENLTVSATSKLINDQNGDRKAAIQADRLMLQAANISNRGGILAQTGQSDLTLTTGELDNTGGQIAANSADLNIVANTFDNSRGQLQHAGSGLLNIQSTGDLHNDDGQLLSNGSIAVSGQLFNNRQGTVSAKNDLTVTAGELDNQAGTLVSDKQVRLTVETELNNREGWIGGNEPVVLTTAKLDNTGGQVVSGLNLAVTASQGIDNTEGRLAAVQDLILLQNSTSLTNRNGSIEAGRNLDIRAAAIHNAQGRVAANRDLGLQVSSLNGAGNIEAGHDLTINVSEDFINGAGNTLQAANRLSVSAGGAVENSGAMEAGASLHVSARDVTNHAGGSMVANDQLTVTAAGDVVNRGSLFGEDVQVTAGNIVNAEATAAIAATNSVRLYAQNTLDNKDGALIYSAGDIDIAGSEEQSNGEYTTRTKTLTNQSANIEADGDITIYADDVVNKKSVFEVEKRLISSVDYAAMGRLRINGQSITVLGGIPADLVVSSKEKGSDSAGITFMDAVFILGEGIYEISIKQDTPQGNIISRGNMAINATTTTNDMSRIMAGKTLSSTGSLNNIATAGSRRQVRSLALVDGKLGFSGFFPVFSGTIVERYEEVLETEQIPGAPSTIFGGGQQVVIGGTDVSNITALPGNGSVHGIDTSGRTVSADAVDVGSSNSANPAVDTLVNAPEPVSETADDIAALTAQLPTTSTKSVAPPQTNNGGNIILPKNGLYTVKTDPAAHYLIETNPKFADYKTFLSSDYLLGKLNYDPSNTMKRLGDGFYEQKLVREQITELTGRVYLNGYDSAEAQYQVLLQNAAKATDTLHLKVGIALTAEQQAALTTDIVWLVEQEIEGQKVLVPVVYLSALQKENLLPSGAIIHADNVQIRVTGDVINTGTIQTGENAQIGAATVSNIGGIIDGGQVTKITANQDIVNISGRLLGNDIVLTAGRDITSRTHAVQDVYGDYKKTNLTNTAEIVAGNTLTALAGQNLNLLGTDLQAGADIDLAGQNVRMGVVTDTNRRSGTFSKEEVSLLATSITTGGNLRLQAVQDITAQAGTLEAGRNLTLHAGDNLTLTAAAGTHNANSGSEQFDFNHQSTVTNQLTSLQSGDTLTLVSDKNMILTGVQAAGGTITAQSGGDLTLNTVTDSRYSKRKETVWRGYDHQMTYDETVTGTNLAAVGDINLSAAGAATIAGSAAISEQGGIDLKAGTDITIEAVTEKHETLTESKRTKSGFLSKKTTTTRDYALLNEVVGSTLSGETADISAGNDLTVKAGNLVATGDLNLTAGNDITIASMAETGAEEHYKHVKKSGLFSGGGLGFTIGSKSEKHTVEEKILAEIGSTVGSLTGDVSLTAGNQLTSSGSVISAGQNLDITGKAVTIDNTVDTYDQYIKHEVKQSGLSVSLGGGSVDLGMDAVNSIERANHVADERLQALYAYKAYDTIKDLSKLKNSEDLKQDVKVSISIGSSKSSSEQTVHVETITPSHLSASDKITITATGNDVTLQGTVIDAKDITIQAVGDINLQAAQNRQQITSNSKSSGWGVGVELGTGPFASVQKGSQKENGATVTHSGSHVTAADTLTLISGGDTNILGSKASGDQVIADIGGDLNIASLQDTDDYQENSKNSGIKAGIGSGITGSYNQGKINSSYQSVTEQAGIYAGEGGFDIEVGGNTDLKGAVISSEATPDKNRLSTDTLTYSDIENKAEYSASSVGVNLDTRKGAEVKNAGLTPDIGIPVSGDASSTTHSAIASGTIEVRSNPEQNLSDLSRDPSKALNALGQIFDKKTVQEQQELAKIFGEVAFKEIGDYALRMQEKATTLEEKAKWADGGEYKVFLHTVAGGLMSQLGGGSFTSGAMGAAVNEAVQKALAEKFKDNPAMHQWASAVLGAAAAKVVGGNAQTGASTAASGTKNNVLSHSELIQMEKELQNCKTEEEKRAVLEKWGKISKDRDEIIEQRLGEYNQATTDEEREALYKKWAQQDAEWGITDGGVSLIIGDKDSSVTIDPRYEGISKERQEILNKVDNATNSTDKLRYSMQFLGQGLVEQITNYRDSQYNLAVNNGLTPELAASAADNMTWNLLGPALSTALRTGNVLGSGLGNLFSNGPSKVVLPAVKKAINSNLPHAVERAVERKVFDNSSQASDALKKLSEKITKEGFPSNAILDTAHVDRVLVPVGNNGMAVYQVAKNGTAKLKTILIAK
ncbi:putative Filamentous hemagglutinin family outer membrane protein [uncultured Sporomusa sp.]|uniref:Putative Filamentous hemagglutinin family outer membrane protein n=1 Tax=uncultured Sporomusa sp. TaxID=307249 RepID=A0A212LLU0_9FIRM|nr:hemagglutinin repeat-containing protein [uncultured Sporomusa sp.]SCM78486.1 putative Filamentous hemagglutinin family outer membrane protein [uncultured Sporomusa sp.]